VWLIGRIFNFHDFPFCLLRPWHLGDIEYLIFLMGLVSDLHFAILEEGATDLVFQVLEDAAEGVVDL